MSRTAVALIILASFSLSIVVSHHAQAEAVFEPFAHQVSLHATGAGSYTVTGTLGGVSGEFLLDTGASMITVSREFFEAMAAQSKPKLARQVGARLASGRVRTVDVYELPTLELGSDCVVGPVEVAVMPRGGRNLLGMSALTQAAPFAVSASPPVLALSACSLSPAVAVR